MKHLGKQPRGAAPQADIIARAVSPGRTLRPLLLLLAAIASEGCAPNDVAKDEVEGDDTTVDSVDSVDGDDTPVPDDTDLPPDTDVDPCAVPGVICRLAGTVGPDPVTGALVWLKAELVAGPSLESPTTPDPATVRTRPSASMRRMRWLLKSAM